MFESQAEYGLKMRKYFLSTKIWSIDSFRNVAFHYKPQSKERAPSLTLGGVGFHLVLLSGVTRERERLS